jgi:hypothetical protein
VLPEPSDHVEKGSNKVSPESDHRGLWQTIEFIAMAEPADCNPHERGGREEVRGRNSHLGPRDHTEEYYKVEANAPCECVR